MEKESPDFEKSLKRFFQILPISCPEFLTIVSRRGTRMIVDDEQIAGPPSRKLLRGVPRRTGDIEWSSAAVRRGRRSTTARGTATGPYSRPGVTPTTALSEAEPTVLLQMPRVLLHAESIVSSADVTLPESLFECPYQMLVPRLSWHKFFNEYAHQIYMFFNQFHQPTIKKN